MRIQKFFLLDRKFLSNFSARDQKTTIHDTYLLTYFFQFHHQKESEEESDKPLFSPDRYE